MLGFLPHNTHRLQPLNVAVFGAVKTYYSQACDAWMVNNPGKVIRDADDVSQLFVEAFNKAATIGKTVKGFKACGIEPYNPNIFSNDEFASAAVTKKPIEIPVPSNSSSTQFVSDNNINHSKSNETNTTNDTHAIPTSTKLPSLPTAQRQISTRRPRAKFPSFEITSSPVKSMLENKLHEKILKEQNKQIRLEKRKSIKTG